ncbi:MAG: DHH family phosphoesterase [Candidatus Eisenbacteria bacterium]
MTRAERSLQRLAETLAGARRVLILLHNHPDPDALGGALVLRRILQKRLGLDAQLAYGGLIGRAQNRAMVERLRIPLERAHNIDFDRYEAIVLVDTQPGTGNNALPQGLLPRAVFDHHPLQRMSRDVPFYDIRPHYGAVVTMLAEYLQAAGVDLDRRLATAIFHAIRSETQNLGREATAADARIFTRVFPLVDNRMLAEIEQAPFSRAYLVILDQAFRATRVHGDVAITRLLRMPYPDVPAELADLILRVRGIEHCLVMGVYGGQVYLSLRTSERRVNAGRLLQRIVGNAGRAGGHEMIAGGRVDARALGRPVEKIQRDLAQAAREELGVRGARGVPLLTRRRAGGGSSSGGKQ